MSLKKSTSTNTFILILFISTLIGCQSNKTKYDGTTSVEVGFYDYFTNEPIDSFPFEIKQGISSYTILEAYTNYQGRYVWNFYVDKNQHDFYYVNPSRKKGKQAYDFYNLDNSINKELYDQIIIGNSSKKNKFLYKLRPISKIRLHIYRDTIGPNYDSLEFLLLIDTSFIKLLNLNLSNLKDKDTVSYEYSIPGNYSQVIKYNLWEKGELKTKYISENCEPTDSILFEITF